MTPELERFLRTEDLDDLLAARQGLGPLNASDREILVETLTRRSPLQAVANLLFFPSLIPSDLRVFFLRQNLREPLVEYLALAASVGVQEMNPEGLSNPDRRGLTDDLWSALWSSPAVAGHALISLTGFAPPADAGKMMKLLEHSDSSVRHNALAWLIQRLGSQKLERWERLGADSKISDRTLRETVTRLQEHERKRKEGGLSNLDLFVLPQIPGFSEHETDG